MTTLTKDEIEKLVMSEEPLQKLVERTGMAYPELESLKEDLTQRIVDNYVPLPVAELSDIVLQKVFNSLVAEGNTEVACQLVKLTKEEQLDEDMHTLASTIVHKLSTFAIVATQAHEVQSVVESIATLRKAFYAQGPIVQVNNQYNEGSKFKKALKR